MEFHTKARAKPKESPKPPKPFMQLDPERWEEIAAIGVFILAAFTALGAFNLSGGVLLETWVHLLQLLLGWGVYFAPLILLGLALWLILDSLDRIVNIGWERPLALCIAYLWLLGVLHWISALDDPIKMPGAFQGGGLVGWAITAVLVQAFGSIGAILALCAILFVALILLFNISIFELGRRAMYLAGLVVHLPREIRGLGKPTQVPPLNPASPFPSLEHRRGREIAGPSPRSGQGDKEKGERIEGGGSRAPVAARIIGSSPTPSLRTEPAQPSASAPSAPVIQREWRLPDVPDILEESAEQEISQQEVRTRVRIIEETLQHFGVPAQVVEVNQGPTITQFGVEPGFVEQKGVDGKVHRIKVKVSRISALQHDLELALAAAPIRIEAPVPGRSVVGIEVPNEKIAVVSLRSVIESETFAKMKGKLRIALGQDVSGQPICADLGSMPHLLIAGATGSGKSVCINTVIATLLCTMTPAQVQFVMIDPKRVELVNYNGIPHLRRDVVVEVDQAVAVLQDAVTEMERRFKLFAQKGARNLEIYNHMVENTPEAKLPVFIVIVDELADLMMIAANEVEHAITRLAQMARATGIHLILATQRPSVDVVTGLIKANFPARISFAVTSLIDSRVVLDSPGAEKLLGRGDMLYMASDSSKLLRLQGCFVSDKELDKLTTYWKGFAPPPPPLAPSAPEPPRQVSQTMLWGGEMPLSQEKSEEDDLLPQATEIVRQSKRASVSLLQRKLRIGYSRAARLMELLQEKGIVGPDEGPTKGRSVTGAEHPTESSSEKSRRNFQDGDDEFADWTEEDWDDLDKE